MSSDPYMDRIEEIMAPHPVYGLGWQGDDAEQRAFVRHVYGQAGLDAFLAGCTMALTSSSAAGVTASPNRTPAFTEILRHR